MYFVYLVDIVSLILSYLILIINEQQISDNTTGKRNLSLAPSSTRTWAKLKSRRTRTHRCPPALLPQPWRTAKWRIPLLTALKQRLQHQRDRRLRHRLKVPPAMQGNKNRRRNPRRRKNRNQDWRLILPADRNQISKFILPALLLTKVHIFFVFELNASTIAKLWCNWK